MSRDIFIRTGLKGKQKFEKAIEKHVFWTEKDFLLDKVKELKSKQKITNLKKIKLCQVINSDDKENINLAKHLIVNYDRK